MSMQLYNEQILNRMLDYIKQYQTENGKSPTYRLIGKSVGIENPGTVARYINQLKIRGLIDKDNGGAVAIDPRLFSGRTKTVSLVGTVACGMPILAEENIEGNFQLPVKHLLVCGCAAVSKNGRVCAGAWGVGGVSQFQRTERSVPKGDRRRYFQKL